MVRAAGTGQFDVPVDQKSKSSVLVVSLVERGLLRKMACFALVLCFRVKLSKLNKKNPRIQFGCLFQGPLFLS